MHELTIKEPLGSNIRQLPENSLEPMDIAKESARHFSGGDPVFADALSRFGEDYLNYRLGREGYDIECMQAHFLNLEDAFSGSRDQLIDAVQGVMRAIDDAIDPLSEK